MLVPGRRSPNSTDKQPTKRSWPISTLVTSAVLTIGLSGCSLALDFEEPLTPQGDGGAVDGTPGIDAAPDGPVAVTCNATDTELEDNNTRATATDLGNEIMSVLCTDNGPQDVDYFQFLIGLDVTEDITINLTQRNGEQLGMRLRDSVGTTLELAAGTEAINTIERFQSGGQLLPAGTYFVEVFYPTVASPKAEYTLELVRLPIAAVR